MRRLVVVALLLTACGKAVPQPATTASSGPSFPVTLTDDDGVAITLQAVPDRIITWAPSNTEILFALGLGARVVGVSGPFDNYPSAARTITRVGGASGVTPDIEKVVSLQPDLLLNGFLGGEDWKGRLRALGIPVFSIYASTLDDALADIRTVGRLTGARREAAAVTAAMQAKITSVRAAVAKESPVSCFFEAYYPPLTTVGPHTFIFDVLRQAGCDPVSASAKSDYPQWSVDKLVQQSPEFYVVVSESASSAQAVAKRPGFGGIAAVAEGRVFVVDSDLITRPDPRVVGALQDMARDLHPSAF